MDRNFVDPIFVDEALRRAARRATWGSPSVHNTQPWHLTVDRQGITVRADPARQLRSLDPTARELMISCGCLLLTARVSLAGDGLGVRVQHRPDPADPNLIARLDVDADADPDADGLAALNPWIEKRQTNRRTFTGPAPSPETLGHLLEAAGREGATLVGLDTRELVELFASLTLIAEQQQLLDVRYRAEMRDWTASQPGRGDGVRSLTVPHTDATPTLVRDFEWHGKAYLPPTRTGSENERLVIVCTAGDDVDDWLRAGQASQRVLLELTRLGHVASPVTQAMEVPALRARIQDAIAGAGVPQFPLRVGTAPVGASSPVRPLDEVVDDQQ